MYDWLIVGAGFAGSVLAERLASERNEKVLIIDRARTLEAMHMIATTMRAS